MILWCLMLNVQSMLHIKNAIFLKTTKHQKKRIRWLKVKLNNNSLQGWQQWFIPIDFLEGKRNGGVKFSEEEDKLIMIVALKKKYDKNIFDSLLPLSVGGLNDLESSKDSDIESILILMIRHKEKSQLISVMKRIRIFVSQQTLNRPLYL